MIGGKSNSKTTPTALGSMLQAATYGMVIPTIFGTCRSNLLAIWAQNLRNSSDSNKKGKKKGVEVYVENVDYLIGSNPIEGVLQMWLNNNRYPLNFIKYSVSRNAEFITIPDANFYFVIGCTADITLSGTFDDYGGTGSFAWGPVTMEYPLWNKNQIGPDITNPNGVRLYPWTFQWSPSDLNVVSFRDQITAIPSHTTGNVNIYYAAITPITKGQSPAAWNRFTFEEELGNGTEYADFTAQQIVYPMYAGLGSPNADLGSAGALPNTSAEVKGSHALYSRGDADFMDMIEDVLKSGMLQAGGGLSFIHRGLNLNTFPGIVQSNRFFSLELSDMSEAYWQPNRPGSTLVVITRSRPGDFIPDGPPTIADTNGNEWNEVFALQQKGVWYSEPCVGGPDGGGNVVTCEASGGHNFSEFLYISELDPSLDTFDTSNVTSGTGSGPSSGTATGTITTTGSPSFILVAVFCDNGGYGAPNPPQWNTVLAGQDGYSNPVFSRIVTGPGTFNFSIPVATNSAWYVVMLAFKQSQPAPYAAALGNVLDPTTSLDARMGARAGGLIGSLSLTSQDSGDQVLDRLFQCCNTAPFWSGFRLKTVFRSEASAFGNGVVYTAPTASGPVLTITESMMIADSDGTLVKVTNKTPAIDAPNIFQMQYRDRNGDYNPSVASWPETGSVSIFGPKKQSPIQLDAIVDPLVARIILAIEARRAVYVEPITYEWTGKTQLQLLEPMDLVLITDTQIGLVNIPVRITQVEEGDDHSIKFTAEPFLYGIHAPNTNFSASPPSPYQPGTTEVPDSVNLPIIFEPVPQLSGLNAPAQLWAVVSDGDTNYGGCVVMLSTDGGSSYNPIGTIQGNAATGHSLNDWPIATDPDTTNDLQLDLTESLGILSSFSTTDEDQFIYPCYIASGTAGIPYGLMAYGVAHLDAANQYTLKATGAGNHLRRCVYGAPQLVTDVDHPVDSRWAFLNPAGTGIFKVTLDPKWIGFTLHFKFLAFNKFQSATQALADATDYSYTPTGIPGTVAAGINNQYSVDGGTLTNPTATSIAMAAATAEFLSGPTLHYNARTFAIPAPSVPTIYYVTIADPSLTGDSGTTASLTATCQVSNALVGIPGNIYIGSITALPGGGGTNTSPGGNPPEQLFLVNGA